MDVLLVDDEPGFLKQAEIFLEKEDKDICIETVSSAGEALELLNNDDFDCIVSDYKMPKMDGIEFLEIVRKEKNSNIPFIVFTGRGHEDVAMKALNLGADNYLQKNKNPNQYTVLADTIKKEINRKKERKKHRVGKPRTIFKVGNSYAITIPPKIYKHHINPDKKQYQFIITENLKDKKQITLKPQNTQKT